MVKTICFDKNLFLLFIILIGLIIYLVSLIYQFQNNKCQNNEEKNTISGIEINLKKLSDNLENYQNNKEIVTSTINYPTATIQRDPKEMNSLDRVYNPLRYPYKSDYFYDQTWYPNLQLPFQVIGCGARNGPCLGGTQVPIYNPPTPIDISNNSISPINISTRGPLGKPQQLGVLYKINGNDNDILPLFGRRRYPNDNKYDYYTTVGQFGSKVQIVTKNKKDELGSNDVVFIKGIASPYRVTIYEGDFPQYIPYL
jgi:hypothetical protein